MAKIKLFGLIGGSLSHSYSERFFNEKFLKNDLTTCDYRNFELDSIDEFPRLLRLFPELVGLNVTIPYKEKILKYVDVLDEQAKIVGAANTLVIKRYDKKIIVKGYNTDVYGFEMSLLHTISDFTEKALILGTGGASKSVKYVLDKLKIENNTVSRRQEKHAKYLYQDISKKVLNNYKIIINCTPLGMYPNVESAPDIPYSDLTKNHVLIDLVYNPPTTKFMQYGISAGASVINGLEMLKSQAEKSWEIFCS